MILKFFIIFQFYQFLDKSEFYETFNYSGSRDRGKLMRLFYYEVDLE